MKKKPTGIHQWAGRKEKENEKKIFSYIICHFFRKIAKKEFPQWETLSYDFLRYILFLKSPILTKILRNGSLYRTGRL